jgi:hypothetical protein
MCRLRLSAVVKNTVSQPPVVRHFKWMGPLLIVIAAVLAAAS